MGERRAVIIGAGPAGLTAAYELLTRTDIKPVILEKSDYLGGISRTVRYKGNRIDIGGHRFFSKSDRVMDWWLQHIPLEAAGCETESITYHNQTRDVQVKRVEGAQDDDCVMLVRPRKSRIYFMRQFFDYPISLTADTLKKLGLWRTTKIGVSYMRRALFPLKTETNLEHFFINRFGMELYRTFFKSYTEKVWGVRCQDIDAEWGAQRIKGLSVWGTIKHFVSKALARTSSDFRQKDTQTSLIEQFLYPKLGPGQMWEEVASKVLELGGTILMQENVEAVHVRDGRLCAITACDAAGTSHRIEGDYFFSTMPVQELVKALDCAVPDQIHEVADGLKYRDFITVGVLLSDLRIKEDSKDGKRLVTDNWIYIQEPDVNAGRLQIFNNWSPALVAQQGTVWLGVEYFCNEGDALWSLSDDDMKKVAIEELARIDIIEHSRVLDATVIRVPKTYPAYFGTYERFDEIRAYVDSMPNLFLIGRNGMHRYNNQDHSMLTAMVAVDNIIAGREDKSNIWDVNTEMEYHESSDRQSELVTQ